MNPYLDPSFILSLFIVIASSAAEEKDQASKNIHRIAFCTASSYAWRQISVSTPCLVRRAVLASLIWIKSEFLHGPHDLQNPPFSANDLASLSAHRCAVVYQRNTRVHVGMNNAIHTSVKAKMCFDLLSGVPLFSLRVTDS